MEKSLHHELRDFEDIEFEEKKGEKEEDLKMLLDQALFQVCVTCTTTMMSIKFWE